MNRGPLRCLWQGTTCGLFGLEEFFIVKIKLPHWALLPGEHCSCWQTYFKALQSFELFNTVSLTERWNFGFPCMAPGTLHLLLATAPSHCSWPRLLAALPLPGKPLYCCYYWWEQCCHVIIPSAVRLNLKQLCCQSCVRSGLPAVAVPLACHYTLRIK
jgi:hypothetical protein